LGDRMTYDCTKIYKLVGNRIAYYRKQKNMTQEQLAEKVGISTSYLSKIEAQNCNKSFSLAIICQIANVLDIDIKDFFDDMDSQ